MSSVATAPAPPEAGRATHSTRARRPHLDALLGLALAGLLVVLALLTTGGVDLAPNTWVEIVLIVLAAGAAGAAALLGAPGRGWGVGSLLVFAALGALTFASIAWSVQPSDSWLEGNRTLSYLAVFATALALARLTPARWRALVGAVATYTTVLCGYALLVKVFPGTLDRVDVVGRLHAPFDYWNATGLVAMMGLPACVWAGTRASGSRVLRALSVPAIAVLLTAAVLSYGRGALIAAVIGLAVWFVLVPLRLRSALLLGLGGAGAAVPIVWALKTHAISGDAVPLAARVNAGQTFGIVLVLTLLVLAAAGFAVVRGFERVSLAAGVRRRIGIALVVLVALVPVGGIVVLAASSRGLTGQVSHAWSTLTNPRAVVRDTPNRLTEISNSRPRYWREGLKVGEHALLAGVGAGGFATARTRYALDQLHADHAHSYLIETFADFGLIGVALTLALLAVWLAAVRRTLGAGGSVGDLDGERHGLIAMLAVVVTFGVHSTVDFTWFIPGCALPALACAGWLAGRGPLTQRVGRRPRPVFGPGRGAAVVGLAALALLAAWMVWQPLRSVDADASAISALSHGDGRAALADARSAVSANPLSADALLTLAGIYQGLGQQAAARVQLRKAVSLQPSNPVTWQQLGTFDLDASAGGPALRELDEALALNPKSLELQRLVTRAQAEVVSESHAP